MSLCDMSKISAVHLYIYSVSTSLYCSVQFVDSSSSTVHCCNVWLIRHRDTRTHLNPLSPDRPRTGRWRSCRRVDWAEAWAWCSGCRPLRGPTTSRLLPWSRWVGPPLAAPLSPWSPGPHAVTDTPLLISLNLSGAFLCLSQTNFKLYKNVVSFVFIYSKRRI